jgi:hypothetical protein
MFMVHAAFRHPYFSLHSLALRDYSYKIITALTIALLSRILPPFWCSVLVFICMIDAW